MQRSETIESCVGRGRKMRPDLCGNRHRTMVSVNMMAHTAQSHLYLRAIKRASRCCCEPERPEFGQGQGHVPARGKRIHAVVSGQDRMIDPEHERLMSLHPPA